MRIAATAAVALTFFGQAACLEPRVDDPIVLDAGSAAGPEDDAGTSPVVRLGIGAGCVADAECDSEHCALPCEGYGTCAPASCGTDAECAIAGAASTHCCMGGVCNPIPGTSCGNQAGPQGTICGSGGDSDCAAGLSCLNACVPTSFCAAGCSDDAECEALNPALGCFTVAGKGKRCVADPEKPGACTLDEDCRATNALAACAPRISYDGSYVIKTCQETGGSKRVGETCTEGARPPDCASGLCIDSICSAACETDDHCTCPAGANCPRESVCLDVWFNLGRRFSAAERFCYPAARCESTAECGGRICVAWPEKTGWSTVCDSPSLTTHLAGAECTRNGECRSGVCHGGVCRELCGDDSHCDQSLDCQTATVSASAHEGAPLRLCL